jgi:hypothetical protein
MNDESRKMQKWLGPIASYDSSMAWRWTMSLSGYLMPKL